MTEHCKAVESIEFQDIKAMYDGGDAPGPDLSQIELEFPAKPRKPPSRFQLYTMATNEFFKKAGVWQDYKRVRDHIYNKYGLRNYVCHAIAQGIFFERIRAAAARGDIPAKLGERFEQIFSQVPDDALSLARDRIIQQVSRRKAADEVTRLEWVFRHMPGLKKDGESEAIDWPSMMVSEIPDLGSVRLLEWAAENRDKFYTSYHAPRSRKTETKDEGLGRVEAESTQRLDELLGEMG